MQEALLREISMVALLVAGVLLGVEGLIGVNLLLSILGGFLTRLVYLLFGAAAGYLIYLRVRKKPII